MDIKLFLVWRISSLMFRDLGVFLPILGGYKCVEESLDVLCNVLPSRDL